MALAMWHCRPSSKSGWLTSRALPGCRYGRHVCPGNPVFEIVYTMRHVWRRIGPDLIKLVNIEGVAGMQPDWVIFSTWNDVGEHHYIGPMNNSYWGAVPSAPHMVMHTDFPHMAYVPTKIKMLES